MSVMRCLPPPIARAIADCGIAWDAITELRFRAESCSAVTYHADGMTRRLPLPTLRLTEDGLRDVLVRLCAGSVHAYDEGILRGCFSPQTLAGVRVGVAGRLLCSGGRAERLQSMTSLCIRLPHTVSVGETVRGKLAVLLTEGELSAQTVSPAAHVSSPVASTLFYAPPGEGKTTLLRCVIDLLCSVRSRAEPICAAVLDLADELCATGISDCTVDRFCGYPRGLGIEIATRAFAPQVILCDEIGSEAEAEEILRAQASGVPLIATAHADTLAALLRRPCFRRLHEHAVFSRYVRLIRSDAGFDFLCEEAG